MSEKVKLFTKKANGGTPGAGKVEKASIGCCTELKNSDFVGIDLLNRLEESPRKFNLRALNLESRTEPEDTRSALCSWANPVPYFSDEAVRILSPIQITKTLEYFLLCSERVNQMTRTYDDVDAITELLEEKEKDLELAAKIGQSLLDQNRELQQRNEFLEEQFSATNDQVTQLKHELNQKIDLLHIYADTETEAGATSPLQQPANSSFLKKVRILEEENAGLKLEFQASHLRCLTQGLEEKEQQLVHDCVKQLEVASRRVKVLHAEIAEKSEECSLFQTDRTKLLKELLEAQINEKKLAFENEDLTLQLHAAKETQNELTGEIVELQQKYSDVLAMIEEAQEELCSYRKLAIIPGRGGSPLADSLYGSLQSELEASDSGFYTTPLVSARSADEHLKQTDLHIQRTMNTVKHALERATLHDEQRSSCQYFPETIPEDPDISVLREELLASVSAERCRTPSPSRLMDSAQDIDSREGSPSTPGGSVSGGKWLSPKSGNFIGGKLSHAPSTDSLASYAGPGLGEPGIPGTRDLEFAIRRLSIRRKVEMDYQKFREAKGYAAQPSNSAPAVNSVPSVRSVAVVPGSVPSKSSRPKLYKPLEGSRTLKQWRMLATPSLFGAINSVQTLPGVRLRTSFFGHLRCSTPIDREATPTGDSGFSTEVDESGGVPSVAVMSTPGTFSFVTSQIPYPAASSLVTSPSHRRKIVTAVSYSQDSPLNPVGTRSGNNPTSLVWSSNAKSVMKVQMDTASLGLNVVASGDSCDKTRLGGIFTRAELLRVGTQDSTGACFPSGSTSFDRKE